MIQLRACTLAAALLASLPGCRTARPAPPAAAGPAAVVLARGEGFTLTAEEFQALWRETCLDPKKPPSSPEACQPARRSGLLDNVLRFKVLAVEARRRGLQDDPEVVRALEKLMVQRLVQQEFQGTGPGAAGDRAQRAQAFDALVGRLRAGSGVVIDEAALEALPLEPFVPGTP